MVQNAFSQTYYVSGRPYGGVVNSTVGSNVVGFNTSLRIASQNEFFITFDEDGIIHNMQLHQSDGNDCQACCVSLENNNTAEKVPLWAGVLYHGCSISIVTKNTPIQFNQLYRISFLPYNGTFNGAIQINGTYVRDISNR